MRLLVEIDRETEPISGLVRRLGGSLRPEEEEPTRRFSGYMELIAALEGAAPAEVDEPASRRGDGAPTSPRRQTKG